MVRWLRSIVTLAFFSIVAFRKLATVASLCLRTFPSDPTHYCRRSRRGYFSSPKCCIRRRLFPSSLRIQSTSSSCLHSFVSILFDRVCHTSYPCYLSSRFVYPAVILAPFTDSCGVRFRKRWISLGHFSLENAGAAFIKWGQWAAARPDLFPRDLCAELSKLHSKAPAHKYSKTKQIIERAFGRKIDGIFEDFEEEPVASGSIAQILRAVLRYWYPGQISKPQ